MTDNIIQIMFDDGGAGDVPGSALFDSPTIAPTIEAWSANALVFSRFYTGSSTCSPSRCDYETGQRHQYFNVFNPDQHADADRYFMRSGTMTVGRIAQSKGYRVGHFGKWHLGEPGQARNTQLPTKFGIDRFHGHLASMSLGYGYESYNDAWWLDLTAGEPTPPLVQIPGVMTDITFAKAIEWIQQVVGEGKKFLAKLWLSAPHEPVELGTVPEEALYAGLGLTDAQIAYFALYSNVDTNFALLLDALDELGVLDETHIMFCSDNGPERAVSNPNSVGSTGGLRGHKRTLGEGGLRVPCMWSGPGVTPGTDSSPRWAIDWLPTVAAIVGADASGFPGSSMLAAVGTRDFFWEEQFPQNSSQVSGKWVMLRGDIKLHRYGASGTDTSDDRFFNVSTVTGEEPANQLTGGSLPGDAAAMQTALSDWWTAIPKLANTNYTILNPGTEEEAAVILDGWYGEEMEHARVYAAGSGAQLTAFESALSSLFSLPEEQSCAHGETGVTETAIGSIRSTHSTWGTATVVSAGVIAACCDPTLRANCSAPELAAIDAVLPRVSGERDGD